MTRDSTDLGLLYGRIIGWQRLPIIGPMIRLFLFTIIGIDIPTSVQIGTNLRIMHGGHGIVIHGRTTIGNDVVLFPGVTVGIKLVGKEPKGTRFVIDDGVVIASGAKILAAGETLTIGRSAEIGANAVVLESVGIGESWVGVPAKLVRTADIPGARNQPTDSGDPVR